MPEEKCDYEKFITFSFEKRKKCFREAFVLSFFGILWHEIKTKNIEIADLAKKMGYEETQLRDILTGETDITISQFADLCVELELNEFFISKEC